MSIIYALSVSFGYIGKAAVLLVIMQIPGPPASPDQMMLSSSVVVPFFPFTYGIDAT